MKTQHSSLQLRKTLIMGCAVLAYLQFTALGAVLTNRYSFTVEGSAIATDSVGGKNGTLVNTTVSGGQAPLANPFGKLSGDATGQYVALPPNLVTNYTAITMETWLTPNHDDFTGGAQWNRIWDFGNTDGANGITPFMWMRSGNDLQGIRADVVPVGGGSVVNGPVIANLTESHVVFTCNGGTQRGRMYVNGVQVGLNDQFADTPAAMGSTTNNFLGRSQFYNGDVYMVGSINEFRIWSGDLNPLEVAASYQSGADSVFSGVGTATNVQLKVTTPLAVNSGTKAAVLVKTTTLSNAVDIADSDIPVVYTSGNTSVLTVETNGNVSALLPGTTTIVATYAGLSSTQSVNVISVTTVIKNRYSFTSDVTDSVGGKNGTLAGGAVIVSGEAVLDPTSSSYVDLPGGLINPTNIQTSAVTFESWATIYPLNGAWTRLFDFGGQDPLSFLGYNYVFFAPNTAPNGGFAAVAVSDANPGFNGENAFQPANVLGKTNVHIVVTYNPNPSRQALAYYLNGELVRSITTTKPLTSISNVFSWLGRSTYSGDSFLAGSINEFRIYDGELDRFQIAATDQAGPGTVNFSVGPVVSFVLDLGGSTLGSAQSRQLRAKMNFTSPTNVDVSGLTNLTLTSSAPSILTVTSPGGVLRGVSPGSATVTGVFAYTTNSVTKFYTNSQALSVVQAAPADLLVHRYGFTANANDSVGTANATLIGGATVGGGQVTLDGSSGYVALPAGIVSALKTNATFEIWLTDKGSGNFSRIWDFGAQNVTANGALAPNMWLTPATGGSPTNDLVRFDWSQGNINATTAAVTNVQNHIVLTYDDVANANTLYLNGVQVAVTTGGGNRVALSSINDTNNWLGRSEFPADSFLNASITEFRIYAGLLSAAQVQANYAAGPDVVAQPPVIGPTLAAALSGNNLIVTWPTNGSSGFVLESRGTVSGGSWANAPGAPPSVVGLNYQQTVPLSNTNGFLRLKQ